MIGAGGELPGSVGLAVFFLVGVLGGAHCLGMCGPLVTLYADRIARDEPRAGRRPDDRSPTADGGYPQRRPRSRRRPSRYELRQHLLFNLGRTLSYATIGALMGLFGAFAFGAASVAAAADGLRAVVGVFVGGFIVLVGLGYVLRGSVGSSHTVPGLDGAFSRVSGLVVGRIDAWARGPRIVGLGALHGLLPCPILYPAFLYALARGSPVEGALSLAALGLGTVPALFAYGTVVGSLGPGTRRRLHHALGVAFVLLGYIPLSHGLVLLGVPLPHPTIPIYQPLG